MLNNALNNVPSNVPSNGDFIPMATWAILTEQQALSLLINEIDERFNQACQAILDCRGRVVVMGVGKSGHIGRKIAATLASTGTPAFFVHPSEAGHGDLGMITQDDVVIAISNSGNADEIALLLPAIKQLGTPLISISRSYRGVLPMAADIALTVGASVEACPLGLTPTASTTATLALGDALAISLLSARNFQANDFAKSHPAGALGRKLLTRVSDVMHSKDLPLVGKHASVHETLLVMTSGRLGLAVVCDDDNTVMGIFTDGDLRRYLASSTDLTVAISTIMTSNPKTIDPNAKADYALQLMNNLNINQLLVLHQKQLQGIVSLHDVSAID